jgi:hypothetical protein
MIGSLPAIDPAEALAMLAAHPLGLPAWPQLPRRSFKESMVAQISEGFPGIVIDEVEKRVYLGSGDALLNGMAAFYEAVLAEDLGYFAMSREFAAGLHAFLDMCDANHPVMPFVKGQMPGPFTFGLSLNDEAGKPVWFDEQYRDVVLKGVAMKAAWMVRELQKRAGTAVIFLDEPIFSALGTPAYMGISDEEVIAGVNEVVEKMHSMHAAVGSHCCGNMDWSLLARTEIDIIAFDAYVFGDRVALYGEQMHTFLDRGGILAWGIVPTGSTADLMREDCASLRKKIVELENAFTRKGIDLQLLRARRMYTPSCGVGNLTSAEAGRVLQLLKEVSDAG